VKEPAKTGKVRKSPQSSVVVPPPPSLAKATKATPTSNGLTAEKTALQTRPSTADQRKTVVEWLDADDGAPVIMESLFGAIERVNAHAQRGDEAATKDLIAAGNTIARYLFLLWAGPGRDKRVPLLRMVAAKESGFPVSFSVRKNSNVKWGEMVEDLAVGSERAERSDANAKFSPDAIDAIVDSELRLIEYLQVRSSGAPIPEAYREVINTKLVKENAKVLAIFLAAKFEKSDPSFFELGKGGSIAFATLGRHFRKRLERKNKGLIRRRACALEIERGPNRFRNSKRMFWEDEFDKLWDGRARAERAKMKQTPKDIRTDLLEAISSRLKTRLKASPKKPD
jgi:hypothetical protein